MYIISFNIMFKDDRKIVLTESPYLFVNKELKPIIDEIRKLIREDFLDLADQMKLPATKLALGMTTFTVNENSMHFFEIDVMNVRELNKALQEN